ncbi:MAG: hypothetical protein ACAH89_01875 [Rariglobus sp.]|nr:hypothetical protein [Rariglobus sp.]
MAIFKRYLTPLLLGLTGLVFLPAGRAQAPVSPTEPPPVFFRTLAIGNPVPLKGLLYEFQRKSVPLMVSDTDASMLYQCPPQGTVSIYREEPPIPPETKRRRIPVAEVRLGKDSSYWIALSATTLRGVTTITPFVINDSWDAHPLETVRVMNFSRRNIAVKVDDLAVELSPVETHTFPYPGAGTEIVRFQVATKDEGAWTARVNSPQGIIHKTRATIAITDIEPSQYDPTPDGINIINMIDATSPPPKTEK